MSETNIGGIYTLQDIIRAKDPGNDRLLLVAQTLARSNPIVREAPMVEANQALSHVGSRNSKLPTIQKRALNEGVPKSAHKSIPITAPMSLYEAMSQVDEEELNLSVDAYGFRQQMDMQFVEAMAQELASDIFYGSLADDALDFNGLTTMFDSLTTYPNGDSTWWYNVHDGGGSGGTASIWIIEWGPLKVHLIYPKGTTGGIEIVDLGKQLTSGATTGEFVAFVTQFKWRTGLFVSDERCVQRVANLEVTGTSNIFNDDMLIAAINQLPQAGENPATRIYCNRPIRTQMDIKLKDKTNVNYTADSQPFGPPLLRFRGIPVQICDALISAESAAA